MFLLKIAVVGLPEKLDADTKVLQEQNVKPGRSILRLSENADQCGVYGKNTKPKSYEEGDEGRVQLPALLGENNAPVNSLLAAEAEAWSSTTLCVRMIPNSPRRPEINGDLLETIDRGSSRIELLDHPDGAGALQSYERFGIRSIVVTPTSRLGAGKNGRRAKNR